MFKFILPDLGEGIHEGEILKWHVQEGGQVEEDAPLVDLETDKAAVTIPSPKGGKVVKINAVVGDTVKVGTAIVEIDSGDPDDSSDDKAGDDRTKDSAKQKDTVKEEKAEPVSTALNLNRPIPAAPATRRLARELGINLADIRGTGPAGRVLVEDLRAYHADRDQAAGRSDINISSGTSSAQSGARSVSSQAQIILGGSQVSLQTAIPLLEIEPLGDLSRWGKTERKPLRSIRRKVARKMVASKTLVPHVAHMDEIDVTKLEEKRKTLNASAENKEQKLTVLAFVLEALVKALKAYPVFNSSLDPFTEELVFKHYYNIGFAADTERGLVVPVIKDIDKKTLPEIAGTLRAMAISARDGKLSAEDFQGGTFTVTNLGALGGTGLLPAINYPEVAILGMGRVEPKAVVREGEIVIRTMMPITLSFDHRVADGAEAARFVADIKEYIALAGDS